MTGPSTQTQQDNVYDAPEHTSTPARVGAFIWSDPGDWITPLSPRKTPTAHWGRYDGRPWLNRTSTHTRHKSQTQDVNTGDDHPSDKGADHPSMVAEQRREAPKQICICFNEITTDPKSITHVVDQHIVVMRCSTKKIESKQARIITCEKILYVRFGTFEKVITCLK